MLLIKVGSVFFGLFFFFLNVFIFVSLNKNISAGNADPVCNHPARRSATAAESVWKVELRVTATGD